MITSKDKYIQHIKSHRASIRMLEKKLTCHVSWSTLFHDLDKMIMTRLGLPRKHVHKIHRMVSKHHTRSFWKNKNTWEMFLDWESARFTKPDKPLSAVEFAKLREPEYYEIMLNYSNKYKHKLADM